MKITNEKLREKETLLKKGDEVRQEIAQIVDFVLSKNEYIQKIEKIRNKKKKKLSD